MRTKCVAVRSGGHAYCDNSTSVVPRRSHTRGITACRSNSRHADHHYTMERRLALVTIWLGLLLWSIVLYTIADVWRYWQQGTIEHSLP